jgi:hypothetical protein
MRIYLIRKNDAPAHDDGAQHVLAVRSNSMYGALEQANKLNASIIAAHDDGDAGYEFVGNSSLDAETVAQVAATLMSAGQIGINDLQQAVDKARAILQLARA